MSKLKGSTSVALFTCDIAADFEIESVYKLH